jgi:hypothetical protein
MPLTRSFKRRNRRAQSLNCANQPRGVMRGRLLGNILEERRNKAIAPYKQGHLQITGNIQAAGAGADVAHAARHALFQRTKKPGAVSRPGAIPQFQFHG